jgi:hypothetical protein
VRKPITQTTVAADFIDVGDMWPNNAAAQSTSEPIKPRTGAKRPQDGSFEEEAGVASIVQRQPAAPAKMPPITPEPTK